MDRKTFLETVVRPMFEECEKTLQGKGDEYSNAQEVTTNFRRNAEKLGVSPYVVHSVYMGKHLDSIERYIRERAKGTWPKTEEPIAGRVKDMINYLLLFMAIEQEELAKTCGASPLGFRLSDVPPAAPEPGVASAEFGESVTASGFKLTGGSVFSGGLQGRDEVRPVSEMPCPVGGVPVPKKRIARFERGERVMVFGDPGVCSAFFRAGDTGTVLVPTDSTGSVVVDFDPSSTVKSLEGLRDDLLPPRAWLVPSDILMRRISID